MAAVTLASGAAAPGEPSHRWYSLYLAGHSVALALRMVPRRFRWRAAALLAYALVPLLKRTTVFREHQRGRVDGPAEIAMFRVMEAMTRAGTEFDPPTRFENEQALVSALESGRGVLVAGAHSMLSSVAVRHLHDLGHAPTVITGSPTWRVAGTRVDARVLIPSRTFLVRMRRLLLGSELVLGMIDRGEEEGRRQVPVSTAAGTMQVSDALLQVSVRSGARVVFILTRLERGVPVVTFGAPSAAAEHDATAMTREFTEFVQAHVARRAAALPTPLVLDPLPRAA